MPKKKGTKKKKRAQEDDFDEASDPTTMMGPGEACTSAAKTSKKKKKMTKEEKAIAALEKQCEKMLQDSSVMMRFLDRMIVWFAKNSALVTKLFQMVDQSGDGIINQKTFKAGMFDLNCPTNMTELHMLTKLLDPDSKDEIKYNEINDYLNKALNSRHKAMHKEAEARQLILSERICVPCPKCAMSRCEPGYKEKFPKFANLEMRMITFDKFPKYPGHFNKVVTTNLPVCGLIEIIVQETKTASTKINIFWDKSRTARARLNPDLTLEECGIQGGAKHLPEQVTLYYDYITEFDDCALLLCDHYFGQKITIT